jgi:glycosyltransferase involved in cell wall biosynthesis
MTHPLRLELRIDPAEIRRPDERHSARSGWVPLVSVIIPHYNDLENLRACCLSLAAQTIPRNQFEIVVADNNSTYGMSDLRNACDPQTKIVSVPIQSAAEARNAGVATSQADRLAFVDSDCRPHPAWLERGLAALETTDMAGGCIDVTVGDEKSPSPVEAFEVVFAFNNERYVTQEGFSVTANMFVSRAVFEDVGKFRFGVSEDKDWGQRAAEKGFRWAYIPDMRVSHPARRNWPELRAKWRRLTRETYNSERQKPGGRLRWLIRAWAMPLSPFVHTVPILWSPKLHRFRDKLNAIGILFRIRWWRFIEAHRVLMGDLLSR